MLIFCDLELYGDVYLFFFDCVISFMFLGEKNSFVGVWGFFGVDENIFSFVYKIYF